MADDLEKLQKEYEQKIEECSLDWFNCKKDIFYDPEELELLLDNVRKLKKDYFDQFQEYSRLLRWMEGGLSARLVNVFYRLQDLRERDKFWYEKHSIAGNYLALVDLEQRVLKELEQGK